MRRRGNVLFSVLIICMFLGAFTSIVCRYSMKIMGGNNKIPSVQEEFLQREKVECEVKGRGMYAFCSSETLVDKVEDFKSLMGELGFTAYEIHKLEDGVIKMKFHDMGKCDLNVEIEITESGKINKICVEVINF